MVEKGVPQIPKGALMRAGTFIYELEEIRELGCIIPKRPAMLIGVSLVVMTSLKLQSNPFA